MPYLAARQARAARLHSRDNPYRPANAGVTKWEAQQPALFPQYTDDSLIDTFLLERRRLGFAPGTLKNNRANLRAFAAYFPPNSLTDPYVINAESISLYLDSRGLTASRSRYNLIKLLQKFYGCLVLHGVTEYNPTADLPVPKLHRYLPHPIPELELAVALDEAWPNHLMHAWLTLGAFAGLRVAEMADLRADALADVGNGPVLRVRGKGQKERLIPAHAAVVAALSRYRAQCPPRTAVMFTRPLDDKHFPGRPFTPKSISARISTHLSRCTPDTPHTAHSLRHRFATQALTACGDLRVVQELLGHADPGTTAIYTYVAVGRLVDAVQSIPAPTLSPRSVTDDLSDIY
jgi:site-specific recombinase XerD